MAGSTFLNSTKDFNQHIFQAYRKHVRKYKTKKKQSSQRTKREKLNKFKNKGLVRMRTSLPAVNQSAFDKPRQFPFAQDCVL